MESVSGTERGCLGGCYVGVLYCIATYTRGLVGVCGRNLAHIRPNRPPGRDPEARWVYLCATKDGTTGRFTAEKTRSGAENRLEEDENNSFSALRGIYE